MSEKVRESVVGGKENLRKAYRITIEEIPFEDLRAGDIFCLWDQGCPDGHEDGTGLYAARETPIPCEPAPECIENFKVTADPVGKLGHSIDVILSNRGEAR